MALIEQRVQKHIMVETQRNRNPFLLQAIVLIGGKKDL